MAMDLHWLTLYLTLVNYLHLCITVDHCPPQHFILKGMDQCHAWLTCNDTKALTHKKVIANGAVKFVHITRWKNYNITLSIPINKGFPEDFNSGLNVLKVLSPSKYIIQLIGYCPTEDILLTEYHRQGIVSNLIKSKQMIQNSLVLRLNFCLDYALILNYIHTGPAGRRVFCDSNSLMKLLSQLLMTDDMKLILNDVDALPEVTFNSSVKCGHRELKGDFVAPEQLWLGPGNFSDDLMPGYNEKTDIWKAAPVCEHFLRDVKDGDLARYRLFDIHKKCRNVNPMLRPTAQDLVLEYKEAIQEFSSHHEL